MAHGMAQPLARWLERQAVLFVRLTRSTGPMTAASEANDIQPADPSSRRRALLWVALLACLGGGALYFMQRWFASLSHGGDLQSARTSLAVALWGMTLLAVVSVAAVSLYMWSLASRSAAALRFPPPGEPVIRDTRILHGQAALRRAAVLRAIAIVLILAAASLVLLVWFMAKLLGQGAA